MSNSDQRSTEHEIADDVINGVLDEQKSEELASIDEILGGGGTNGGRMEIHPHEDMLCSEATFTHVVSAQRAFEYKTKEANSLGVAVPNKLFQVNEQWTWRRDFEGYDNGKRRTEGEAKKYISRLEKGIEQAINLQRAPNPRKTSHSRARQQQVASPPLDSPNKEVVHEDRKETVKKIERLKQLLKEAKQGQHDAEKKLTDLRQEIITAADHLPDDWRERLIIKEELETAAKKLPEDFLERKKVKRAIDNAVKVKKAAKEKTPEESKWNKDGSFGAIAGAAAILAIICLIWLSGNLHFGKSPSNNSTTAGGTDTTSTQSQFDFNKEKLTDF